MFQKTSGLVIAALAVILSAGTVHAQERGLIWSPAKNSDQSYSARVGAKLPIQTPVRAGLEMGMNASEGGALVDTPVKFWGNVTLLSSNVPGAKVAGDIAVLMNALTGSSAWTMTTTRKRIATPELDVEANRNMTVRYDGTAQQWSGLDVSQSLRLTRSETGTAFVLTGASRETFDEFTSSVALEQKFGENLTVTGKLNQGYEDRFRPSINARYQIRW
jgi:hypothetical protein